MWGSRIKLQWVEKRLIISTDILVQNIHLPCPDHVVCPCIGIDILFTPSTRWSYFWRLLCHLVVVLLVVFLFQTPPMSKPLSLWLALSPYPTSWTATKTWECWQLQSLISNQQKSLIIFWFTQIVSILHKNLSSSDSMKFYSLSLLSGFFQVQFSKNNHKTPNPFGIGVFYSKLPNDFNYKLMIPLFLLSFFSPK